MKRSVFAFLALLCCVCLCFSACTSECLFENDKYSITSRNGKYYFNFKNKLTANQLKPSGGFRLAPRINFNSAEEMQQKILSGDISDEQIAEFQLYAYRMYNSDQLEILDITTVYKPTVPEGFTLSDKVKWYAKSYAFQLDGNLGEVYANVTCCSKERVDNELEQALKIYEKDDILSDSIITDRNARKIHYKNDVGEFMKLHYEIVVEDLTLTVIEQYRLSYPRDPLDVSDTVPHFLQVYGSSDQMNFIIRFYDLIERPSVEWLSSLGMVECK